MEKVTQKQCAFYVLYREHRNDPDRYVPAWEFGGEMQIPELNKWVLMSYKCPARLTDLFQENPGLLERELITGKSGSTYYGYRLAHNTTPAAIRDPHIRAFYQKIKAEHV